MKSTYMRILWIVSLCAVFLVVIGCFDEYVTIPANADMDKGLHLTVQVSPLYGTGTVKDSRLEFDEVYAPSGQAVQARRTTVTEGTEANFQLTGFNPGAVKNVFLRIQGPQNELYLVTNQVQRTADNKGPQQQVILGYDGQHKPGNIPIHVKFTKDNSLTVIASTENYNTGVVTAIISYDVVPK